MTIFVIVIGILVLFVVVNLNKFKQLIKSMRKSKTIINDCLKKRYDLIPRLLETTKTFINYDQNTINKMLSLSKCFDTANDMARDVMETEYNSIINKIESFSNIKTNIDYLNIKKDMSYLEGMIESSRKIYTSDALEYNNLVEKFPSSILAIVLKYKKKTYEKSTVEEVTPTTNNKVAS